MMRDYARIENDIVVEIVQLADDMDIADCFHPDFQFVEVTGVAGVEIGWVVSGDSVAPPPPYVPSKEELTTYSRQARWNKENVGITLTSGMPIETNDRAQAKITGVYVAQQIDPAVATPWHAADGTVWQLDAAAIEAMNRELLIHINNCFSISADVLAGIEAGTITTREQIDDAFSAPMTQAAKGWLTP
jgi:hypothetical protein